MSQILAPILFSALVWWASTGVLLWLVRQGRKAHVITLAVLGIAGVLATFGSAGLKSDASIGAAYAGFAGGIVIWAAHEAAFLFGFLTGPRKAPCPPDLSLGRRFVVSTQAVLHHELALAAQGIVLIGLSFGGVNQVMAATFALLWIMRLSTKLIIFLGAPNISIEMLPRHLAYLGSYFNKQHITLWFPVFMVFITAVAGFLTYSGLSNEAGGFAYSSYILLGTLACLAVFEHMALVVPVPDRRLWAWALNEPSKQKAAQAAPQTSDYGRS